MLREENVIYVDNKKYGRMEKDSENSKKIKEKIKMLDKKIESLENIKEQNIDSTSFILKQILVKNNITNIYSQEVLECVEKVIKDTREDIEIYKLLLEDEQKIKLSHKPLKRKIKKRTNVQIKEEILKIIEERKKGFLTKEDIARQLQVKECQVEQVFMELNREGILEQPVHRAPHDCQRDPLGFVGEMGWQGDLYRIRSKI